MPGKPGNLNAAKHGRRSNRMGFVICHLARHERSIEARLHSLRKALERRARRAHSLHGDLPVELNSQIDLIVSFERVHQRAQHLARDATPDTAIELEKAQVWAAQMRHRGIRDLLNGTLSDNTGDPWVALAATQCEKEPEGESCQPRHGSASAGGVGDESGQSGDSAPCDCRTSPNHEEAGA